jgi:hypothetical protein
VSWSHGTEVRFFFLDSSLAKDGTLTIAVPLPQPARLQSGERLVPIKHS